MGAAGSVGAGAVSSVGGGPSNAPITFGSLPSVHTGVGDGGGPSIGGVGGGDGAPVGVGLESEVLGLHAGVETRIGAGSCAVLSESAADGGAAGEGVGASQPVVDGGGASVRELVAAKVAQAVKAAREAEREERELREAAFVARQAEWTESLVARQAKLVAESAAK